MGNKLGNKKESDKKKGTSTALVPASGPSDSKESQEMSSEYKAALNALALVQEQVDSMSNDTQYTKDAINEVRKELKKPENRTQKALVGTIQIGQAVVDNIDKLRSNSPLIVASGAMGVVAASALVVGGPAGPVIAGLCGLIATILPLFGPKEKNLSTVIKDIIVKALEDFKNEEILEAVTEMQRMAEIEITFLTNVGKSTFGKVSDGLINHEYRKFGQTALGKLEYHITKIRGTNDKNKAKKAATYIYWYCQISNVRRLVLLLYCNLLKINGRKSILDGELTVLRNYTRDKELLQFLYAPFECRWIFRFTQTSEILDYEQREFIQDYRKQCGCYTLLGFYCEIYNTKQNEYIYAADHAPYDKDRRRVFTWRRGNRATQGQWRLWNDSKGLCIYNIWQGEYLYAADYAPYDKDRRRVFTWRKGGPAKQGYWELKGSYGDGLFAIFNKHQNEYLYAADYAPYDKDRRRVFTWRKGGEVPHQGYWKLMRKNDIGEP